MDVQTLRAPLYQAKGWMKLLGILSIITGVLSFYTIVGLIMIWPGVMLFQAAGLIEQAWIAESEDAMLMALSKLRSYFTILGIMVLLSIVVIPLFMLFGGLGMIAAMWGL